MMATIPPADNQRDVAVEHSGDDHAGDEEHGAEDGLPHPLGFGEMVGHDVPFDRLAAMLPVQC